MSYDIDFWERKFGKYGKTALTSVLVLVVLFAALLKIAPDMTKDGNVVLNYFSILLGALCGWALGIFYSPYNPEEEKRFLSIGRTISAFVSGYAVSKFDRLIEASLFIETKVPQNDSWARVGLFAASTVLFALLVFSCRAYFQSDQRHATIDGRGSGGNSTDKHVAQPSGENGNKTAE